MNHSADHTMVERAQELIEIAASIKDVKGQQAVIEAAQHYEKTAAQLTVKPPPNAN